MPQAMEFRVSTRINPILRNIHADNLSALVSLFGEMNVTQRKAVLTICRVQSVTSNHILRMIDDLAKSHPFIETASRSIHVSELLRLMEPYTNKVLFLSLISNLVRIERYTNPSCLDEEVRSCIKKEYDASQAHRIPPNFNYSCLFGDNRHFDIPLSIHHRPAPSVARMFQHGLNRIKMRYRSNIPVFYPRFSGKKNMAWSTSDQILHHNPASTVEGTSLDWETHYWITGDQISGPMEMRTAFRYTDLKPRVYYANGGTSYAASRFIRYLVNQLVTILPPIRPRTRTFVNRISHNFKPGRRVLIYDYSSFTTNMVELKNFIFHLAQAFEDIECILVDPYTGPRHVLIRELLMTYNSDVNINAEFDMTRILDEEYIAMQQNSGMLGVQGNINLSMVLHALNLLCLLDDVESCNVIGDDAIVIFDPNTIKLKSIINVVRLIGDIAQDKFRVFDDTTDSGDSQQWHYTKRPITVSNGEIITGTLYDFPNLACVWYSPDGYHRELGDKFRRAVAFVHQVGALFERLHQSLFVDEHEWAVVLRLLRSCYKEMQLPWRGARPGWRVTYHHKPFTCCIPPLDVSVLNRHWLDVMWDGTPSEGFIGPIYTEQSLVATRFEAVGQSFLATSHQSLNLGVALQILDKKGTEMYYQPIESSREILRSVVKGRNRIVHEYVYIDDPPSWYNWILELDGHFIPEKVEVIDRESVDIELNMIY